MNLDDAVITRHALARMAKRDIRPEQIRAVLARPEAVQAVAPGRVVVHRAWRADCSCGSSWMWIANPRPW